MVCNSCMSLCEIFIGVTYGHIELRNVENDEYLDRWPLGNSKCWKLRWAAGLMNNGFELERREASCNISRYRHITIRRK